MVKSVVRIGAGDHSSGSLLWAGVLLIVAESRHSRRDSLGFYDAKIQRQVRQFFRWVKGTELVELQDIDVPEDPKTVPNLDLAFRTEYGRRIHGSKYEDSIEGIVRVVLLVKFHY